MKSRYLLDTNTISFLIARRLPSALKRVAALNPNQILVSSISYGEVRFGLERRPTKVAVRDAMMDFMAEVEILPWTRTTADIYARVRSRLEKSGKPLGSLDMLIASHALESGAVLVSGDRAFLQVPDLTVEDWTV